MDIFYPRKWAKNVQINCFVKTATFLERQLLLTQLQIVITLHKDGFELHLKDFVLYDFKI